MSAGCELPVYRAAGKSFGTIKIGITPADGIIRLQAVAVAGTEKEETLLFKIWNMIIGTITI